MWTRQTTALERLLVTEREHRRTDSVSLAGFAIPSLLERPLTADQEPLLATNMRQSFVPTTVSRTQNIARCGLSECLLEEETGLLAELWRVTWDLSEKRGWLNRCTSLAEAAGAMRSLGYDPRSLVIPYSLVERASGQKLTRNEADDLMTSQGFVANVEGDIQVLVADLPEGKALLTAAPNLTGYYTRIDDRLGILLTRVNRTVFLIDGMA